MAATARALPGQSPGFAPDPGANTRPLEIVWTPQPGPQTLFVTCPVFEVVYGGARGGGKTDACLGDWISHAQQYGAKASGVFFRRELTQLENVIERSKQLFYPLGWTYIEHKKTWYATNGAILKFRYLDRDSDAEKYQGHSYTRIYIEELTNFPDPKPIMKLKATLRSGQGVPTGFRATCNPGGPGHTWVKAKYIDPAPLGYEVGVTRDRYELPDGQVLEFERDWVFIPAKLSDNPQLLHNDPGYIINLKQTGSDELVRAWLEGDWNALEGAFFDCWSMNMILEPFKIPRTWLRFRSMDWGYARPFSIGWWAISDGSVLQIPAGAMVRYKEWYGMTPNQPNVGVRMEAEQIAKGIKSRDELAGGEKIRYSVCDPSMFSEDGGPSHAERMRKNGVAWRRGDNKRVGELGHMGGWDMMRARMKGELNVDGDPIGVPMIYVFKTCVDSIRTIPAQVHDPDRPEDMDSDGEDHAADEWRYACMSRPWTPAIPDGRRPIDAALTGRDLGALPTGRPGQSFRQKRI